MGLTGLSVAWKLAHTIFGTPIWAADLTASIAMLAFIALVIAYGVKIVCAPDKVLAEFRRPLPAIYSGHS